MRVVGSGSVVKKESLRDLYVSLPGKNLLSCFKHFFRNFRSGVNFSVLPLLPFGDAEQLGQEKGGVGFGVKVT